MKPTFRQFIEDMANPKAPGPSTTFTVSHIFFALELLAEKPIGRNMLSRKIDVGEGTIRTLISRFRNRGLIETSRSGCVLTNKGCLVWKKFEELFPKRAKIGKTELTNAEHNYAFLVRNSGHNVRSGIEQRDAAIIAGATDAIVVVHKQGQLTIESVSKDLKQRFPAATNQIIKTFNPENNDAVVIVGATDPWKAKHGAFAASWTLIRDAA